MPLETVALEVASDVRIAQIVFAPGDPGGTLTVRAEFAERFARIGLTTASAFLDLPGEVVSGHPDRHVVRVDVPNVGAFYLKRQHVVGWREKLRNRRAGFGWVSRCVREASILQHLEAAGLPAPRWTAFGTHRGRAFLLVPEVPDAVDLRRILSDNALSLANRRQLAVNVGRAVAVVHAAGFSTPDLTAKHIQVNRKTLGVTFLDWQSSTCGCVSDAQRADALGALHASLAGASNAERLRVLRAYQHEVPAGSRRAARQPILRAGVRHAKRRSVRDQLSDKPAQRLVWLAGEAVCAVPEIAAAWPRPAISPPFYGTGADGASRVRFAGRDAILVRGSTAAPLGRIRAWLHVTPWRSPGVTVGRVLFHLQRYGVSGPRLLAFGQQLTTATRAEWFALYETPPGVVVSVWRRTATVAECRNAFDEIALCLGKLHDAGCVLTNVKTAFALDGNRAVIADPRAVGIVRHVSAAMRRRDMRGIARLLGVA